MSINVGDCIGRLTVEKVFVDEYGRGSCFCICQCGGSATFSSRDLTKRRKKSCGCRNKCSIRKHGMSSSPTYSSWESMKQRCLNLNEPNYKNYGGRGISICETWLDKELGFINFLSNMGERLKGTTLERIDVNGNYCPENCKWATIKEQSFNRRNNRIIELDGVCKNIKIWSIEYGIHPSVIHLRLQRDWSIKDAITLPVNYRKNNPISKQCLIENCSENVIAKGLCRKHYSNQWYKKK